jgi:hypothetical protein
MVVIEGLIQADEVCCNGRGWWEEAQSQHNYHTFHFPGNTIRANQLGNNIVSEKFRCIAPKKKRLTLNRAQLHERMHGVDQG